MKILFFWCPFETFLSEDKNAAGCCSIFPLRPSGVHSFIFWSHKPKQRSHFNDPHPYHMWGGPERADGESELYIRVLSVCSRRFPSSCCERSARPAELLPVQIVSLSPSWSWPQLTLKTGHAVIIPVLMMLQNLRSKTNGASHLHCKTFQQSES